MGFSGGGDDIDIAIGVREQSGASQTVDNFRLKLAALRTELAQTAAQSKQGVTDLASINAGIGAFQKLGAQIDVTSQKAVANFRAQGDAISGYLAKLGATDAQLNRIGNTISQVEQKAGAASIAINNTATATDGFGRGAGASTFAVRRMATSIDGLAISAATGAFNLKSVASEMAGVAVGALSVSGATLGTSVAIGALIAVGATLVGILDDVAKKSKSARQELTDLAKEMEKNTSTEALRNSLDETNTKIRATQDALAKLQAQARQSAPASAFGPGGAPPVTGNEAAVDALQKQLSALQDRAGSLNRDLLKRGKNVVKELDDAQRQSDQETSRLRVQATQGEFAARRLAAEQDFENAKRHLDAIATVQGEQQAAVDAAKRKRDQELATITAEEIQHTAEARAAAEAKAIKSIEEARIASAKDAQAQTDAIIQDARDAREISERQAINARRDAAIVEINAEEQARLKAIGQELVEQQKLLAATTDPAKRGTIQSAINDVPAQQTKATEDAAAKRVKINTDAARQTAQVSRQLASEIEQINVQSLEQQGQFVQAAAIQVQKEFRDAILEASAAGDQAALDAIRQRIKGIVEAAQARQIEATAQQAITAAQSAIQRINLQVQARTISPGDARSQTVAELTKQRDAVASAIPELQRMAALLPGDAQAQAQLEKYTTELLQLNLGIAATSDEFHDLKIASLDALENGLAQGIDDSVTGAKSLSEAWALAAESILHSIQRVISQLLAQIAVQRIAKALGLFDGSAGDDGSGALIDAIVAQGVPGISVIGGKAAGGVIRGPGTGTSDSILARVSNGEGFLTARTVQRIGESGVNALNAGNALVVRRFAEGGVVGATTLSGAAGGIHGRLDGQISLAPGLIGDFLRSPEGVDIQITNLHANRNRVRSIVGTS